MSRLNDLLLRNSSGDTLSKKELEEGWELIQHTKEVNQKCLLCDKNAVDNIRLCRGHLIYCWVTGK